jgi:hypothetical protein
VSIYWAVSSFILGGIPSLVHKRALNLAALIIYKMSLSESHYTVYVRFQTIGSPAKYALNAKKAIGHVGVTAE